MKKLLLGLLCLISISVQAASPIQPEVQAALDAASVKKTVHVIWDPSGNSNQGSSTVDSGVHGLGQFLPPGALVTRSYGWVQTAMTDAGTSLGDATVAFKCEDAANLKVGFTVLGANQFVEGAASGASTVMVQSIANTCEISATVTEDNFSAGKVHFFVDYVSP